ncbi:hypothetical protein [Cellvibrio japonicus]|uniref:hypothetical protein n=1 Tax=Cellvibrio japonicus TaxID=155077 RepID=UPI0005A1F859|nr:hypothetical protein [Cellvibrio japonicus]QEI13506.1 hypothetical protein FY117_15600 [Cellvibrio japonicus]QEI17080.1 hypothetical protein FY116_15605 [Cellvibrio japonicus]QEI20658.1 hypothetical protein FY115_15600 [Cellvibrio japonicus]
MLDMLASILTGNTSVLLGGLIGTVIGIAFILKDSAETNWRKRFREQVKKGIVNGTLTAADMPHLYERWSQNRQSVLFSLRIMLSEAIASEDEQLKEKISEIRELIRKHEEREPFSELPENISIQLNSLKEENLDHEKSITQLASSLTDLYSTNKTEITKQKRLAFWGFLIGVLGVLISISSLLIAIPKN